MRLKASKLREMTLEELQVEEQNLTDQLFYLRAHLATGQLENAKRIRQIRRDIARIKTVINEKRRELAAGGAAG